MQASNLYILILATLLVACSDASTPGAPEASDGQGSPIAFAASGDATTSRATGTSPLSADYKMRASSVLHNNGSSHTYLYNTLFSYQPASATWAASGWYYPTTGTMDFALYATLGTEILNPDSHLTVDELTGRITGMTLNFGSQLEGTDDVLCSQLIEDVTCPTATAVPVHFSHALSLFSVNITAADQTTAERLKISSINFSAIPVSGSLAVSYDSEGSPEFAWTAGASATKAMSFGATTLSTTDPFSCALYAIPGSQSPSLTILYTIDNGDEVVTPDYTTPVLTYSLTLPAATWLPGKNYTYNISCGLEGFHFDGLLVAEWIDGGTVIETPGAN